MIAIAGGHGKIALRLTQRLSARGETVVALIRNPEHADDVRAHGGEPVLCDLEHAGVPEISAAVTGASAVVFAAGALSCASCTRSTFPVEVFGNCGRKSIASGIM